MERASDAVEDHILKRLPEPVSDIQMQWTGTCQDPLVVFARKPRHVKKETAINFHHNIPSCHGPGVSGAKPLLRVLREKGLDKPAFLRGLASLACLAGVGKGRAG